MKTLKEKQLEFLNDTTSHFNSDNRAVGAYNFCIYGHSANGGCAIGRHCSAELANRFDLIGLNHPMGVRSLFDKLPEHLQELEVDFLEDVQTLHDFAENWESDGLSEIGKHAAEQIKNNYNLN